MRKTLAIAAFLTMFAGTVHADSLVGDNAKIANVLQIVSANGALSHCMRELKYVVTGKTDEVAFRKMRAVFKKYPDDERVHALAELASEVHESSDQEGIWLMVSMVDKKIKMDQIALTAAVCANVEAYLRTQMLPGNLLDIPDPGVGEAEGTNLSAPATE